LHIIGCEVRFHTRNQIIDFNDIYMIGLGRRTDEKIPIFCGMRGFGWFNEWLRMQGLLLQQPVQKPTREDEDSLMVPGRSVQHV
jgi:hypothetical protein